MTEKPPLSAIAALLSPGEPDKELNDLARRVIGAGIEVHRHLGPGLTEPLYEAAFKLELDLRGIPFRSQSWITVSYKDHPLGKRRIDLIIDNRLIVELKSVERLAPIHSAQLISYLRLMGYHLGLLMNFNVALLKEGVKRVVLS
ncbi:MAG: GxxExxY protein [Pyrinomonadaceae bacterium]